MPIFFLIYLVFAVSMFVGWVYNVIWTFHQTDFVNLLLGILGAIVAPIGALHGLWVLF